MPIKTRFSKSNQKKVAKPPKSQQDLQANQAARDALRGSPRSKRTAGTRGLTDEPLATRHSKDSHKRPATNHPENRTGRTRRELEKARAGGSASTSLKAKRR